MPRKRQLETNEPAEVSDQEETASNNTNPSNSPAAKSNKRQKHSIDTKILPQDIDIEQANAEYPDASTTLTPINQKGKPAECGIIKKIHVENFMCHRKLTIQLCDNVNFIHGQNGSGKSAILAALQICLGAGARRTNRARNLKDLVRKEGGASSAKVRVTLLNKGPDAFQHDLYGDTITIERSIALYGGYNGYKLLSHSHQEISRKKKDLDQLLDQLNIQVENPVAVLDQEEAKKFLMGKPEDKYNFFTKATDLERIDRHYGNAKDQIYELDEATNTMKLNLGPLKEKLKKLKAEWDQFQQLEKLEEKKHGLSVKYAWSLYGKHKNEWELEEKLLEQHDKKIEKRRQELEKAIANTQESTSEQEEIERNLANLTAEAEEAKLNHRNLQEELKKANEPKKQMERALKGLTKEMSVAKRSVAASTRELEAKRKEIVEKTGSAESEEARRAERTKSAEDGIEDAKRGLDERKDRIEEKVKKYEELQPTEEARKNGVSNVNRQISAVRHKVQNLKRSSGDSLAMFGNKCDLMFQKVEHARRAGKFQGKVVGPVGKYLKIIEGKDQYGSLAELALQVGLDRFIVTNDHDRSVYMRLRREAKCTTRECGVFQMTEGPRYNVIPPPCDGVETVATVLNATDDLVYNCLVDNGRIDQKALTDSKESGEASLLMPNGSKNSIRGNNIKTVYFLPHGDFWQLFRGELSVTSNDKRMTQMIGVDQTAAIREAERELGQLEDEGRRLAREYETVKSERYQYKVEWNEMMKADNAANHKIQQLKQMLEDIRDEAEEAENVTFDTTELEDDVKRAQEAYDDLKNQHGEIMKNINEMVPGIGEIQKRLEEVVARNQRITSDLSQSEDQLQKLLQDRTDKKNSLERRKAKVQNAEELRAQQLQVVQEKEASANETLRKAQVVHVNAKKAVEKSRRISVAAEKNDNGDNEDNPEVDQDHAEEDIDPKSIEPVEVSQDPEYYMGKIRRLVKEIEREKQNRRLTETDPEVALDKYVRAKKAVDSKVAKIEQIERNVTLLADDMKDRKELWKNFRKHITKMTNANFDEILNRKGSSGEVKFDHKSKTLGLIVQKDNKDGSSQTADVKALSGGERSYTTLALLLALGESLETPFRVMDEFDVFLDPVARRIALQTMIGVAKDFEHRQFIFITPQDLSNIKTDPKLKIFHMKPPKRSNVVGGPTQQTLD